VDIDSYRFVQEVDRHRWVDRIAPCLSTGSLHHAG
jgi:hypothetical protein